MFTPYNNTKNEQGILITWGGFHHSGHPWLYKQRFAIIHICRPQLGFTRSHAKLGIYYTKRTRLSGHPAMLHAAHSQYTGECAGRPEQSDKPQP